MAPNDDDSHWTRQLFLGLGALAAISLLIGAVVSVVALAAAQVTGISSSAASAKPSLYMPPLARVSHQPTPSRPSVPSPTSGPTTTQAQDNTPATHKKKKAPSFSLQVFPQTVSPLERINLTGTYAVEGASLQVQRFEGGSWVDFPVQATVRGGVFQTYIQTGHLGPQRLRMFDASAQSGSNPVRVTVH